MPNKSRMNGSTEDWSLLPWKTLVPNTKVLLMISILAIILLCIICKVLILHSDLKVFSHI